MGFYLRDNPCRKDCPDRKEGCHTRECPHGWYEWHEGYVKLKQEEAKERHIDLAILDARKQNIGKHTSENSKLRNKSLLYRIVQDNKIGD
jgi:hypothetical protein